MVLTFDKTEDVKTKWLATLVGAKTGEHQIEIRSRRPWANVVMVVNGTMPKSDHGDFRYSNRPHEVKVSTNGPMYLRPDVWAEMQAAIEEAHAILRRLDNENDKEETVEMIREGRHPLGG